MKCESLVSSYCGKMGQEERDLCKTQREMHESRRTEHQEVNIVQKEKQKDHFGTPEMVAAARRGRDKEKQPKQRKVRNKNYNRDCNVMQIAKLLIFHRFQRNKG